MSTNGSQQPHKKKEGHPAGKALIGMQVAAALEKTGREFWKWVEEIENCELFRKLHQPVSTDRIITINSIKNYYIPPRNTSDKRLTPSSLRAIFKDIPAIYNLFINMGWSRFYYYFVEKRGTTAERAEPLRVPYRDTAQIEESIHQRLSQAGVVEQEADGSRQQAAEGEEMVAEIVFPDRQMLISYTYPVQRYTIDEEKLYTLMAGEVLQPQETREFYQLRRKLESINFRFGLIQKVVEQAVQQQRIFLTRNNEDNLQVLEERHVAERLNVDPSWISRILKNKYLVVQHRLVYLKDLFISERNLNKKRGITLLRHIITRQNQRLKEHKLSRPYSDEELRMQFLSEYDFEVSRRSINNWKRELERENKHGTDEHMGQNRENI